MMKSILRLFTVAIFAAAVSCTPDGGNEPEPPVIPEPPKPEPKKERTISGRNIGDFEAALKTAKAHPDSTYFIQMHSDWEIDSVALHQLNECEVARRSLSNLTLYRGFNGIYAPDEQTEYIYEVWANPGLDIKPNPENGAKPVVSFEDYRLFEEAGQKNVVEKSYPVVELTREQADDFSATIAELAESDAEKIMLTNPNNYAVTITDENTLPYLSTPSFFDVTKQIQLDADLKIAVLYSLKWHVHTGLFTANFAWVSEAMGQKTEFRSYQAPYEGAAGEIIIGGKDENKFTVMKSSEIDHVGRPTIFTAIQTLGKNSVLPNERISYILPDGTKYPDPVWWMIDALYYSFYVTPQDEIDYELARYGDLVDIAIQNSNLLVGILNDRGVGVLNTILRPGRTYVVLDRQRVMFGFTPVTRNPVSIAP